MDTATYTAFTEIIQAQASILRALQLAAHFSKDAVVESGVAPLIEDATTHLEEAMKAIQNG